MAFNVQFQLRASS